jgi:hypothetical protein
MANTQGQPLAIPSVLGSDGESFSVVRTGALSSAIGIGGSGGRTFVTNAYGGTNNASNYGAYGYGSTGTTTSGSPTITVSYGYGGSANIRTRYRMARSYSIINDNGVIRLVVNGLSRF